MSFLTPDTLLRVEELFLKKKWKIETDDQVISLFSRFCARLKLLTPEQQDLMLELTEYFVRIQLSIYLECFYASLMCLGEKVFDQKEKIFVCPLITPFYTTKRTLNKDSQEDFKIPRRKTKSAEFLHYMFDTDDWRWLSTKFIVHDSTKRLPKEFDNANSVLLLIDDYIGSGETAIDVCKEYLAMDYVGNKILEDNMKVVCIAAQRKGVENVKDTLNVEVVSEMVFERGISDRFEAPVAKQKLSNMQAIELCLGGLSNEYMFGFRKSEALITILNKTPNNTFPVFWYETKSRVAPFPRYKNFL